MIGPFYAVPCAAIFALHLRQCSGIPLSPSSCLFPHLFLCPFDDQKQIPLNLSHSEVMDHHSDSQNSNSDRGEVNSRSVRPTTNISSRKRQSQNTKAAYPRKRAVQACRTCRLRRTKCDNEHPSCTSCVSMGIECIYQERDPSK